MNFNYKDLTIIQKKKFSELHSNYHKLLNTMQHYNKDIRNNEIILRFMELNETIDKFNSDLIYLKEEIFLEEMNHKELKKSQKKKIKDIEKDNKAIQTFLPLIIMYRNFLN